MVRFSRIVFILLIGFFTYASVIKASDRTDPANPGQMGSYAVKTFTYGSGSDKRRSEFRNDAAVKTRPVNAAPMLKSIPGLAGSYRDKYWGFNLSRLPLNGRVWYPVGEGPFPLILIVHGNHQMSEFSDVGYGYLGELMASRGFIFVSIDENFLNGTLGIGGFLASDYHGAENIVRAWLLLKHLEVWRAWSSNPDYTNPVAGKIDIDKIVLIGHSRGGEAVATAAAMNRLAYFPDDANIRFNFNFNIRSVVAIAPIDGQYTIAGHPTPLTDLNYLVIHGSHDGDVSFFAGTKQYQRVEFSEGNDCFKASLYIYKANHGQFNTVWGNKDLPAPLSWMFDTDQLMKGEEQRQIAKVYISAFVEATLNGRSDYRKLFVDNRIGEAWLPKTTYITNYEDSKFKVVSDFEEDIDLTTTTLPGGTLAGKKLSSWKEMQIRYRNGQPQENSVAFLGWGKGVKDACYTIQLPVKLSQEIGLTTGSKLVFLLADGRDNTDEPALDMTVEITTKAADTDELAVAGFPLSLCAAIPKTLAAKYTYFSSVDKKLYKGPSEPSFQRFELPLDMFIKSNPSIDPANLVSIRFVFNTSAAGSIYLDRLGFEN